MAENYHLRRQEKAIEDLDEIYAIIREQAYMTLAMCCEDQPYLVTMNYGFDSHNNCLYFHCANEGKKLDYLRSNPKVWGQIIEDGGYVVGECDHAYRCIEFDGVVDFLISYEEKKHALDIMIDHIEPDPEPLKQRMVTEKRAAGVTIGRVKIHKITGKKN